MSDFRGNDCNARIWAFQWSLYRIQLKYRPFLRTHSNTGSFLNLETADLEAEAPKNRLKSGGQGHPFGPLFQLHELAHSMQIRSKTDIAVSVSETASKCFCKRPWSQFLLSRVFTIEFTDGVGLWSHNSTNATLYKHWGEIFLLWDTLEFRIGNVQCQERSVSMDVLECKSNN